MYAIVSAGGKQYRVAEGDVLDVERIDVEPGDTVTLPALLLVDGESVTTDADQLAGITVQGEVVGHVKGPKIRIIKFKNKTRYRKRQGHRQQHTRVRVTGITGGN